MTRSLLSRLARLETQGAAAQLLQIRIGDLVHLPVAFVGERHVVIVSREVSDSGYEIYHREERPGPAPPGSEDQGSYLYFTEDDMRL